MSNLSIDQKTIRQLFDDKKADFLIPDYQRPYEWGEDECRKLWDDVFDFAFPEDACDKFKKDDEYFLGPIVTFENDNGQKEVIDGQQRLTTLMLLLRAFYAKMRYMKDSNTVATRESIERCIWKTDEFGRPDMNALKIDSDVVSDEYKEEFVDILKSGVASGKKSRYADNYCFFQKQIDMFLDKYPGYFAYFPVRLLNNCILLPIEAESQDRALRIFSTLNDRGLPLSDADIFKSQFYKYFGTIDKKEYFIAKWKELDEKCRAMFHPVAYTPTDEIFMRYMYYVRAKNGNKNTTVEGLRTFYERNSQNGKNGKYALLQSEDTFDDLNILADFWKSVADQDDERFSTGVLRRLFVLNYMPNGMWCNFVSVYFMHNKDSNNLLDNDKFQGFLEKTAAFVLAYSLTKPGVNALRTPMFGEMINIVNGKDVSFASFRFNEQNIRTLFGEYVFSNNRTLTKSFLAWWAFNRDDQPLLDLNTNFDIEHIFSRNRQNSEKSLSDDGSLDLLGNKSLLEKRINIRASDYKFCDKVKYYKGFTADSGKVKEGTRIAELQEMTNRQDFTESDIIARNNAIIDGFVLGLQKYALLNE